MKLAVMQPYFFPYIGYFQLLRTADLFVIYDDVQFIKEGWIHRNRLLINGQPKLFTLPLNKASHETFICDRTIATDRWNIDAVKLLKMIDQGYRRAPFFKSVFPLVEKCFRSDATLLAEFVLHSMVACCDYIGIETKITMSSSLSIAPHLRGQERILAMCKSLEADDYVNAIGGMELYSRTDFERHGVRLSFLKSQDLRYPQFKNDFLPWLSIIDVMMFNSVETIDEYLEHYALV